jgi:uncharacterized SAM-binding protein YcdF (DUF218 family)
MRKFCKIIKIIFWVFLTVIILDVLTVLGFSVYRPNIPGKTDAIIVLGAAIYTPSLDNRSLEALKLYQAGKAAEIVVSGGRVNNTDITEAADMKKVIERSSGSAVPVVLEDQSADTYQNIKFSKAKIPNAQSVIIVSDSFHLARGVIMAWREGFAHVYWASPNPDYYTKGELAFYYFREMVAMVDYIPKFIKG